MSETPVSTGLATQPVSVPPPPPPGPPGPPPPLPGPPLPLRRPLVSKWPGPSAPAGPVPLAAAATAGVLAAALVPLGRPGLGWVLAGVVVCAATAAGLWRAGVGSHRQRLARLAWAVMALALLAVGAVRAAEWLFAICLVAAAAATVPAVTSGRTVRGLALGTVLVPAAAWRAVAWAHRSLAGSRRRRWPTARIGPTAAITALVLLVFGGLFASADAAFSRLLGSAVPDLQLTTLFRGVVLFVGGTGLVLAAVFLLLAPPTVDRTTPDGADPAETGDSAAAAGGSSSAGSAGSGRPVRLVRLVEWAVPVGALVALFASFVAVQLAVLFGGAGYVLGPDGPTYAQHARGGFWQLLAVTALTLLVIGVAAQVAPSRTALERWCLRGLLGALAILTLVIVASAMYRMHTYQEAYGFTRLRVLVSAVELWLGLVFLLVLAAGIRLRAHWLPRAVLATALATALALVVVNPDRLIAERNLDRWVAGEQLDTAYLAGLSADAVPALVCLPEPVRSAALARIGARVAASPDDWRSANLSRATAREMITADVPCPPGHQRVPSAE